jgi:hypothetical protein
VPGASCSRPNPSQGGPASRGVRLSAQVYYRRFRRSALPSAPPAFAAPCRVCPAWCCGCRQIGRAYRSLTVVRLEVLGYARRCCMFSVLDFVGRVNRWPVDVPRHRLVAGAAYGSVSRPCGSAGAVGISFPLIGMSTPVQLSTSGHNRQPLQWHRLPLPRRALVAVGRGTMRMGIVVRRSR